MRIRKAAKTEPAFAISGIDATPERMAKGESDVVQALIDRAGERPGNARKFRASHLDRLHKSGSISYYQWYAGNWYREQHDRCQFPLSVVASYGERSGAGEYPGTFGYGLPRQEAQLRAREALRMARAQFPRDMVGFMDRLLIHDTLPRYGGRAAMRNLAQIRRALDTLAGYLQLEVAKPMRWDERERDDWLANTRPGSIVFGPADTRPVLGRGLVEIMEEAQAELLRVVGIDPAFLDESGLMRSGVEIAEIIRGRLVEKNDG